MPYAVIQTGGRQYRVQKDDVLEIDLFGIEPGAKTTFEEVLLAGEGASVKIGDPFVKNAKVEAVAIERTKGEKLIAFKFRRRQGYHRTVGHRQKLVRIKITDIQT